MIRKSAVIFIAGGFLLAGPVQAQDRRGDVSLQASVRQLHEFAEWEVGLGARLSYRLGSWLAVDADLNLFPADAGTPAFSGSRVEGLAGVRVGPRLGRPGGYAALRAGAVRFSAAPEPFACILIFPPPLSCAIAVGETVPSAQASLGWEAFPGPGLVVRVEAGDQLLRYPGPAFAGDGEIFEGDLWSHNFKATASVGLRF